MGWFKKLRKKAKRTLRKWGDVFENFATFKWDDAAKDLGDALSMQTKSFTEIPVVGQAVQMVPGVGQLVGVADGLAGLRLAHNAEKEQRSAIETNRRQLLDEADAQAKAARARADQARNDALAHLAAQPPALQQFRDGGLRLTAAGESAVEAAKPPGWIWAAGAAVAVLALSARSDG